MDRRETLLAQAKALGFDAARIARADEDWPASARLEHFVAEGRHATMAWMEETVARRKHPQAMWTAARSALVVAMSYGPDHDPMETLAQKSAGNISVYARGRDYHDVLKGKLKQIAQTFAAATGAQVKVFTDTAPLMEKPLAEKAGLGWQGKHTNLVSRDLGSWFFIGVMLTDAALVPDAPHTDHCGACHACLEICPTAAFPAPYQLDARRCLSYLTIEHAGPIPAEFRAAMGNRIYGCDDCLAVCPWNKFAVAAHDIRLKARPEWSSPPLAELARLDDASFRTYFSGSAVKRTGRDRFVRNVAIAIGNSDDPDLLPNLLDLLDDASPLVRGAAVWALFRLDRARFALEKSGRAACETDDSVREEWAAGT